MKDADFWTSVIGGSANLVMAGAMVIQTIIILGTAALAYRKYSDYLGNKLRAHALSVKKDTQKLIYIQDIILSSTEGIGFKDYQNILKKKMEGEHYLMYVKSLLKHNLYLKYIKEIQKLQMRVERELEFLGDKKLKSLNAERESLFQEIIRKLQVVEGTFTTLYSEQNLEPEILNAKVNLGYKIYRLIPELIGSEDDQSVLEINLEGGVRVAQKTKKASGLKLLDKQFNDMLANNY